MTLTVPTWSSAVTGQIGQAGQLNQLFTGHQHFLAYQGFASSFDETVTRGDCTGNYPLLNNSSYGPVGFAFDFPATTSANNIVSNSTTVTFTAAPVGFQNGDAILINQAANTLLSGAGTATWTVATAVTVGAGVNILATSANTNRQLTRIEFEKYAVGYGADCVMSIFPLAAANVNGDQPGACIFTITIPREFFSDTSSTLMSVPIGLTNLSPRLVYLVFFSASNDPNNYNLLRLCNSQEGTLMFNIPTQNNGVLGVTDNFIAGNTFSPTFVNPPGIIIPATGAPNLPSLSPIFSTYDYTSLAFMQWKQQGSASNATSANCYLGTSHVWGGGIATFKTSSPPQLVQSAKFTGTVSATTAFTCVLNAPTTAGNLVVAYAVDENSPHAPTFPAGWTSVWAETDATNNQAHALAYLPNCGAISSVTWTSTDPLAHVHDIIVAEFSGALTSTPLDASAHVVNQTPSSNPTTGNVTTTQAGELIVGLFMDENSQQRFAVQANLFNGSNFSTTNDGALRNISEDSGARWIDIEYDDAFGSSTCTTYTATGATDASALMQPGLYIGRLVTAGASTAKITSNTQTTITVASWTGGTPASGVSFTISNSKTVSLSTGAGTTLTNSGPPVIVREYTQTVRSCRRLQYTGTGPSSVVQHAGGMLTSAT
jgi:hypothetical protein